jgi:hypothetical protein
MDAAALGTCDFAPITFFEITLAINFDHLNLAGIAENLMHNRIELLKL